MEVMRVAVCDDDAAAMGIISSSLKDIFTSRGIDADIRLFPTALDLRREMEGRRFDLLLLDIDMPGLDGITFAHELREAGDMVDIMYISSREDKVFDSLRVSPKGFIRKSRFLQDMSEVVGDYLANRKANHELSSIVLKKSGLVRPLRASAIAYVEGQRNSQEIHLVEGGSVTIRSAMHTLEEELAPAGFIRVHQGYIVNYREIKLISNDSLELISGEVIPISRRKVKQVRTQYLSLVQSDEMVF